MSAVVTQRPQPSLAHAAGPAVAYEAATATGQPGRARQPQAGNDHDRPAIRRDIHPSTRVRHPQADRPAGLARFAGLNRWGRPAIPSGVHVQLGFLFLPVGPADAPDASRLPTSNGEAYTAHNELSYGYSSPSGCVTLSPRLTPPPNAHCILWTFLNANTGHQIDSTYQQTGHWHWLLNPKEF